MCTMCADGELSQSFNKFPLLSVIDTLVEWLITQLGTVPTVLIAQAGPQDKPGTYSGRPWPSCTLVLPRMKSVSRANPTFHPKFMLLFRSTFVRLVISTANLMSFE